MLSILALACQLLFQYAADADEAGPRPNVLFIVVDDLRPEPGCYGNQEIKTPHFDSFANREADVPPVPPDLETRRR